MERAAGEALNSQPHREPGEKQYPARLGCRVRNKPLTQEVCTGAQMKENQKR